MIPNKMHTLGDRDADRNRYPDDRYPNRYPMMGGGAGAGAGGGGYRPDYGENICMESEYLIK